MRVGKNRAKAGWKIPSMARFFRIMTDSIKIRVMADVKFRSKVTAPSIRMCGSFLAIMNDGLCLWGPS